MTTFDVLGLGFIAIVSFAMSYLGAAVGLVLGQARVVLLTYMFGSVAVGGATSIAISAVAAVGGAVSHARNGRVHPFLFLTVGVPSTIAAYVAARYAGRADPLLLKAVIAVVLLLTGLGMLRAKPDAVFTPPPRTRIGAVALLGQMIVGAVLGAISGLVGLLLGSLRLPALVRLTGAAPSVAVGTNMAIGAVTGVAAGCAALGGGKVNLLAFALLSPVTLIGAHLGAQRTGGLDRATLRRWIAYTLIPTGLFMILEITLSRLG
jgi:uncharacterized membrane protein YfcA